jgi:hypothetical protein
MDQIRRSKYALSENKDDSYRFGRNLLSQEHRQSIIFTAGTPALILPTEIYTHSRRECFEILLHRFSRKSSLTTGSYLFNFEETVLSLRGSPMDSAGLDKHIKRISQAIHSPELCVYGLKRPAALLPSGILSEEEGAILVKDPVERDRFIGVYFIRGKELDFLRNRIHIPTVTPQNIYREQEWLSVLRSYGDSAC